jgi:hypothetical protein
MYIASIVVLCTLTLVSGFGFHKSSRWHNRSLKLNSLKKDDKGYVVKDRDWFQGLSQDAGASLTDPRAVPKAASDFADRIKQGGKVASIDETLQFIDTHYNYFEVPFSCGELNNPANVNIGSAKIFSFAILTKMDEKATLRLFGPMVDSLKPDGTDHPNIRNFMKLGWNGIVFSSGLAIVSKLQAFDNTEAAMATQAVLEGKTDGWDADSDSWIP